MKAQPPSLGPVQNKKWGSAAALDIMSASIEPSDAEPGDVIELRLAYEVRGLSKDEVANVTDERIISFNGRSTAIRPDTFERGNGKWSYRKIIRLPEDLAPGEYKITCRLSTEGSSEQVDVPLKVKR